MAEKLFENQNNYGWNLTWDAAGKYPMIAKRIFKTYQDALDFANDETSTAITGLVITVTDDTADKNGVYRIVSIKDSVAETKAKIEKLGSSDSISSVEGRVTTLETTVGDSGSGLVKDAADLRTDLGNKGDIASTDGSAFARIAKNKADIATLNGGDTEAGSVKKAVKDAKDTIDAYTVNTKKISANPVLDGTDIALTGYDKSLTEQTGAIAASDTINKAIAKLENKADAVVDKIELTGDVTATEVSVIGNKFTVNTDISADTITTTELANDAVQTENILNAAVTTAKIKDANVTDAKIKSVDGQKVNKLTGYTKPESYTAIGASDPLNTALGKLEAAHIADETAHKAITVSIDGTQGDITAGEATITTDNKVVLTAEIDEGAVTNAKLGADAVTNAKLADNAVQTENILKDAVTDVKIAGGITATKSEVKTYTTTKDTATGDVAQGDDVETAIAKVENKVKAEVDAHDVKTVTLSGDLGGTATAQTAKAAIDVNATIQADAVTTAKIKDLNVTTGKLAANAVTNAKLAADAVKTVNILDANVTDVKLATDSVITAKIKDLNVTTGKLANDAVTTAKIKDANVTDAKIDTVSATKVKLSSATGENADVAIKALQDAVVGGTHFIGITEGELSATNIVTDKYPEGRKPTDGDFVIKGEKEYIFSVEAWKLLGDVSAERSDIDKIINGITTVPHATYATKIGTETSHSAIGTTTQPVYVDATGTITAGKTLGASAYHEDNYFASAAQGKTADSAIQSISKEGNYITVTGKGQGTTQNVGINVTTDFNTEITANDHVADAKSIKEYVDKKATDLAITAEGDTHVTASVDSLKDKKHVVVKASATTIAALGAAETSVQTISTGKSTYLTAGETSGVINKMSVTLTPNVGKMADKQLATGKLADAKDVKDYVDTTASDLTITAKGDTDYIDASVTGKKNVVVKATTKTTDAIAAAEKSVQTITSTQNEYIKVEADNVENNNAVTITPSISTNISTIGDLEKKLADAKAVKTYVDAVKVTATGSTLVNASAGDGRTITLTDTATLTEAVSAAEKSVQTIVAGKYIGVAKTENPKNNAEVTLSPNIATLEELKGQGTITNKFADADTVRTVANDIKTTFDNLKVNGVDTTADFVNHTASVTINASNIQVGKALDYADTGDIVDGKIDSVLQDILTKLKAADDSKVNKVNGTAQEVAVTGGVTPTVSLIKEKSTTETVAAGHIAITNGTGGLFAQMYYDGDDVETITA